MCEWFVHIYLLCTFWKILYTLPKMQMQFQDTTWLKGVSLGLFFTSHIFHNLHLLGIINANIHIYWQKGDTWPTDKSVRLFVTLIWLIFNKNTIKCFHCIAKIVTILLLLVVVVLIWIPLIAIKRTIVHLHKKLLAVSIY